MSTSPCAFYELLCNGCVWIPPVLCYWVVAWWLALRVFMCTQAMMDLETDATEPLEENDMTRIIVEKARYKRKAREWLVQQADGAKAATPAKKTYRRSSYRLLLACEHMLEPPT